MSAEQPSQARTGGQPGRRAQIREQGRAQAAAELRERLAALDPVLPPPGLAERVTAPAAPQHQPPGLRTRRWSTAVLAGTAVVAVLVGIVAGVSWQRRQDRPAPPGRTDVTITVFNAEVPCQQLRTIECGLAVHRDPRHPTPQTLVDRVWHGDRLLAFCVVPDGHKLSDETGITSTRWYRVRTPSGVLGYLPGVRTRNVTEVQPCPEPIATD